jgi:putative oxidoreductase
MEILKKIINNKYFLLVARVVVALIFIIAAIPKISNPAEFAGEIARYNLMPNAFLNIMALALPWIELITAIFLLVGIRMKANSVIISGMLLVFVVAIGLAMVQGLNINCGCHTKGLSGKVGWAKIFEDIALMAFCAMIFFSSNSAFTLDNYTQKNISPD